MVILMIIWAFLRQEPGHHGDLLDREIARVSTLARERYVFAHGGPPGMLPQYLGCVAIRDIDAEHRLSPTPRVVCVGGASPDEVMETPLALWAR